MSGETKTGPGTSLPALHCMCANLRRAARAVTRLYNHELQTAGIEITQLTLLMALERTGEISQGELGRLLALDSTSLTRMLRLLEKPEMDYGEDRGRPAREALASHCLGREEIRKWSN